jgi:hypothetical protein
MGFFIPVEMGVYNFSVLPYFIRSGAYNIVMLQGAHGPIYIRVSLASPARLGFQWAKLVCVGGRIWGPLTYNSPL